MYSFKNDYSEGAHPRILARLTETNLEQTDAYGEDCYTLEAVKLLKDQLGRQDADIHLFAGGTQTNLTAISAFLRPHEAAIAANTGHICVHETGAIEATGHKVLSVDSPDGKLTPGQIAGVLTVHGDDEHMVKPKLVYISNPTEIGTIYTKQDLSALSRFCREHSLYLYIDGARLGSALCSAQNDLTMADIARLADAFYIGGTKNGALIGEALIIVRENLKEDFRYHMKQKGALLAKSRLLGLQFTELFRDNLYFELAAHANAMAALLRQSIETAGYPFLTDSYTNQLFPILPNSLIDQLKQKYAFYVWAPIDASHSAIRLVTSWATREEWVSELARDIREGA